MTEINNTLPIYHEIVNIAETIAKAKEANEALDNNNEPVLVVDDLATKLKL